MTQGNNNPQNNFNPQNMNVPQDNLNIQNGYPQNMKYYPGYEPENKGAHKLRKAVLIVSAVLFTIGITIFAIIFVNNNTNKSKGKNEHLFTAEELKTTYGFEDLNEKEYESDGITYTMCFPKYSSGSTRYYEYYMVYIFKSQADAKDYFEDMKSSYFSRITAEEENAVEGWISGICDADQRDRIELKDNVILVKELEFVGYDW